MLITLPPQLNASTLRHLVKSWPDGPSRVELHFNKRQWASPTGMVGLACLIDKLRKEGGEITLEFNDCDTVGYWERMGFFREAGLKSPEGCGGVPQPAVGRFAEMRRVGDIDYVDEITQELVTTTGILEQNSRTFSHILSEAMNNVCQHSGSYGFSAAQYWQKTGRVEFCIADSGCGLFSALSYRYGPENDARAIDLALKVGVTSRSPRVGQPHMRNRGVGLSCVERLVKANGGSFEVWSEYGRYTSELGVATMTPNHWTGTLLTVNMQRNHLTADFHAVMQQLTAELRLIEVEDQRGYKVVAREGDV